ncbi:MAG TPA: Ig-like domain-containing protein [Candidatus Limnocylindria bacterium]|nr:Ig-like domain-containing protein [Candidatus Limnocylindria bacterium]
MPRQLLQWWCALAMLFACVKAASAATHFVGAKKVGTGPFAPFFWNPTNLVIQVGDTVMWTNLMLVHSVNPATNSTEPFCGTGTNEISSCTVTFQNPGLFFYDCYQHLPTMTGSVRVLSAPVVVISNPPNNALFATQADVQLQASATDLDGSVTNVQFLNGGVTFASSSVAPYTATLSNAAAGTYSFRALALDNSGLSTTSAPVTVRVIGQPMLVITNNANSALQFSYDTSAGVNYVVEGGETVTNLSAIVTNAGTGSAQQFSQTNPAPAQRFFRLRLQ